MKLKVCNIRNGDAINVREYEKSDLLDLLKTNNNLYEYIDTEYVKPYFDIDIGHGLEFLYSKNKIYNTAIKEICNNLKCNINDLIIIDGSRKQKISFHFICKKYKITPKNLLKISNSISFSDKSVYPVGIPYKKLRMVNQCKFGCNSYNTNVPLKLIHGEIENCIVTDTEGLPIFQ